MRADDRFDPSTRARVMVFPENKTQALRRRLQGGSLVVLGSVNLDYVIRQPRLPVPGETIFGRDLQRVAGGKGLNQALAAARAGADVAFLGRIGEDDAGEQLAEVLAAEGVDVRRLTADSATQTGIAQVSVLDGGDNAIVVIPGANDSDEWAAEDASLVASASALVTQLERPAALVRVALASARRDGVVTILTPAPVSEQATELLPLVDVLLLNEHEAHQLASAPDGHTAASKLSEICGLVIMTRGPKSTLVAQEGAIIHEQPSRPTNVVDTTGAGDCFAGTLTARLAVGDDFMVALRAATVAASLSVGRAGAAASMPSWQDVLAADGDLAHATTGDGSGVEP